MKQVWAVLMGGSKIAVELAEDNVTLGTLRASIAKAVQRPEASFTLVRKGTAMHGDDKAAVDVEDGDTFLVAPQRKAPSPGIVSAAIQTHAGGPSRAHRGPWGARGPNADEDDDDGEEDPPMQLPANAPAWEHTVVAAVKRHCCSNPAFLDWVILIRPYRFAMLLVWLVVCYASSRLGMGPIFILASIAALIFCNLGKRKPGEASAYSIFNPGVRALPGQLDASEIDRQFRHGQMG